MTRTIYAAILLLTFQSLIGQNVSIKKTWIGSKMEYLCFRDSLLLFNNNKMAASSYYTNEAKHDSSLASYFPYRNSYRITDSTLTLVSYTRAGQDSTMQELDYPFAISKLTGDTLILIPVGNESNRIISKEQISNPKITVAQQPPMIFTDSAVIDDRGFTLQKIYSSSGLGMIPGKESKLEIEADGTVFYLGIPPHQKYDPRDEIKLYRGKLNRQDRDSLICIMRHSALERWPEDKHHCSDGGNAYYHIWFDNKDIRRSLQCIYPPSVQQFCRFLYSCTAKAKVKPYSGTHSFEK